SVHPPCAAHRLSRSAAVVAASLTPRAFYLSSGANAVTSSRHHTTARLARVPSALDRPAHLAGRVGAAARRGGVPGLRPHAALARCRSPRSLLRGAAHRDLPVGRP